MNKIFQISLITSVLATAGFAAGGDTIPVDVYGKLELNGGTDTEDSTVRASGTLNVVADSTLESVLTLEPGAVMNIKSGATLTNSREIQINPTENAQIQKYINETMYYEFDDEGSKIYCADAEGTGGFVDENGDTASPTGTPTKSMHTTITGSPTGDGAIDMKYVNEPETKTFDNEEIKMLNSDDGLGSSTKVVIDGSYYVYSADLTYTYHYSDPEWRQTANALLYSKTFNQNYISNLAKDATDLGDPNEVIIYGPASSAWSDLFYYRLGSINDPGESSLAVSNVSLNMYKGVIGKITSDTATASYVKEGAATLDSDDTDFADTNLSSITSKFVLSSAESTGWSENWTKNLPTIKYTDDEAIDHEFDKTGQAPEIAAGPEAYLNSFGIYPNEVNDDSTSAIELLSSKAVTDAVKIPAASTIAVDVDATVSANLHNIGESSATTAFSGEGVLTLSGNNQYLGGEVSFNKVAISSQNSIPGGDVTVNTSLQVSSDADLTGTLTMSTGSALSVDEGKSLKVFGTLTLE